MEHQKWTRRVSVGGGGPPGGVLESQFQVKGKLIDLWGSGEMLSFLLSQLLVFKLATNIRELAGRPSQENWRATSPRTGNLCKRIGDVRRTQRRATDPITGISASESVMSAACRDGRPTQEPAGTDLRTGGVGTEDIWRDESSIGPLRG